MTQVAREETADDGWLRRVGCRYRIHDGETKFCEAWKDEGNRRRRISAQ